MFLGGLGRQWMVTLDCWATLVTVWADWLARGGLEPWWVVSLDCRAIFTSVQAVWVVLEGLVR